MENTTFAPPSADVLGEAARQIATAYPDLFAHQRTGIAFLLSRRSAILADDMGLGKTRQAIVALREAAREGPLLIVCPAGLKLNWEREIRLVEPSADIRVVRDARSWEGGHRWTIVNYDLLGRLRAELAAVRWAGVVLDEAHYLKNDSQRTKHVFQLLGVEGKKPGEGPEFVYLLTGTPMTNRPRDLYNLLKVVRHPLATSFYTYATRYCAAYDNGFGLDTNGASNLDELVQIVSGVMLRRTKDETLDLPPKVRTWQPIEIAGSAAKDVGKLEARALDFLDKHPARSGATWVTFLARLNQARHALAVAKAPATIDAARERLEAGEKVVVFTSYSAVVAAVKDAFGDTCVTITGDDSPDERQAAADALQTNPDVTVLVGNLQAAGVGLNLTAATQVIFNDLDWVPGNLWQAEDRIYRIGQHRPAFVTYLFAAGTLDDFVAALLEAKARNIGVLEAEAADNATLVEQVVQAALNGERPSRAPRDPARAPTERSVGLLDETLDLLARARRGLGAVEATDQEFRIESHSRPGKYHTVRVSGGVARCDCEGFQYRGNCSHAREITRKVAGR
jgi:SWI/SNF-related matrix-associated actin-dependent regulator 1 of chromatin subfamily A